MQRTLLWLLAVSLLARIILSALRLTYGLPPFLAYPVPWLEAIRLYNDFDGYYMNQLYYVAQGFMPYRDIGINFPPLFVYTLYPFYILGGPAAAGIPIVLSDAATAPIAYLIVRGFSSNKIALIAGLAYALSPFMLLFEGYSWFGNQPMTFFVVLSLYLFRAKKPIASSIALGLAILFRQQALFILPVYAVWALKEYRMQGLRLLLLVLAVMLIVSAPFLLIIPGQYLSSLSYLPLYHWTVLFGNPAQTRGTLTTVTINFCSSLSAVASGFIMSCNFGTSHYLTFAPYGSRLLIFANNLSFLIRLPIAILVLPLLYLSRRKKNSLELTSAYAAAISVVAFAVLIHQDIRYYYILFYCLLLTSVTTRSGLAIAIGTPILSVLIPEVAVQELLPFIAILVTILVQEIGDIRQSNLQVQGSVSPIALAGTVSRQRSQSSQSHIWDGLEIHV